MWRNVRGQSVQRVHSLRRTPKLRGGGVEYMRVCVQASAAPSAVTNRCFVTAPHGREMSQDLRKKIISLHKKGEGYKKISKALLISQNTVAKVVQTFKKDGTATISQRRPGRRRKLTPRQERLLMRRVEENQHASSLQLSKEVESQTGVTISRDTIRRTLQRNGMYGCRPRKKPLLKPRHKKVSLEFARAHADKDEDYWDSILWSDETKLNVFGTDGFKTVWRRKGEEYKEKCMVPTVKHGGGSVLMWGCMSAAGVGELYFIDGIMNSQMYCFILKEKMLPSLRALGRRALFQHDPKHTSKATVGFLKKNRVKVIQWPSMSPDLNPIEHLWGILKRQVEHHSPSSIQSLKEVILEEWKKDRSGKMSPTCSFHALKTWCCH